MPTSPTSAVNAATYRRRPPRHGREGPIVSFPGGRVRLVLVAQQAQEELPRELVRVVPVVVGHQLHVLGEVLRDHLAARIEACEVVPDVAPASLLVWLLNEVEIRIGGVREQKREARKVERGR